MASRFTAGGHFGIAVCCPHASADGLRRIRGIILFLNKMISSFYLSRYTADCLGGGKKCIDFVF